MLQKSFLLVAVKNDYESDGPIGLYVLVAVVLLSLLLFLIYLSKTGQATEKTLNEDEQTIIAKTSTEEKKKQKKKNIIAFLIIWVLIPVLLYSSFLAIYAYSYGKERVQNNPDKWGAETNPWVAANSIPPDLTVTIPSDFLNLGNIILTAKIKEEIKKITFRITLRDSTNSIVKEFYFTENNLRAGETYVFTYNLLEEMTLIQTAKVQTATAVVHKFN